MLLLASTLPQSSNGQSTHGKKTYIATVYLNNDITVKGILYHVNDSSISIYRDASDTLQSFNGKVGVVRYPCDSIQRIYIIRKGSVGKGMAIGAPIGLLVGLVTGGSMDLAYEVSLAIVTLGTEESNGSMFMLPCVIIGTLTGAGIGALVGLGGAHAYEIDYSFERFRAIRERLRKYQWIADLNPQ